MTIDQWYVEMMIPHHESIIAMAEAALPRLSDKRLLNIANAIVAMQQDEIDRLANLRSTIDAENGPRAPYQEESATSPPPLRGQHGEHADDSAILMDATALVTEFCSRPDADLAFITLAIPHHQMAIDASRIVLAQGTDPMVRDIARNVIATQQREIEALTAIGADLATPSTPVRADTRP